MPQRSRRSNLKHSNQGSVTTVADRGVVVTRDVYQRIADEYPGLRDHVYTKFADDIARSFPFSLRRCSGHIGLVKQRTDTEFVNGFLAMSNISNDVSVSLLSGGRTCPSVKK